MTHESTHQSTGAAALGPSEVGATATGSTPTLMNNPAGQKRRGSRVAILLTAVQLPALGILGTIAVSVLAALLGTSIGLLFVFGLGLFVLIPVVYLMFGLAWFEVARSGALYGFDSPPLARTPRTTAGFLGYLRQMGRQAVNGRMWIALANLGIGAVFGLIIIRLATLVFWSLIVSFAPATGAAIRHPLWPGSIDAVWMPLVGPVTVVLSLAAIWGLAALHASISRGLLGAPTRGALAAEARAQSVQRAGAVRAADVERTRIERDLHDGVQPRLVSVGMTLGLAQQKIDTDPAAAKALIDEAHTSTKAAITELRQLARGIHASVLDDRGLDAALSALAGRSHVPVLLDVRMEGRPDAVVPGTRFRDAEAAVYFSIAESITNAAKHSRASEVRVIVRLREPGTPEASIWAKIEDNGIGGAHITPGGGLDGISNRVLAAGGSFRLDSPAGGPTTVEVSVPCA